MHLLHTILEWLELIIDVAVVKAVVLAKMLCQPSPVRVNVMTDAELV